jgi:hypothetical protein
MDRSCKPAGTIGTIGITPGDIPGLANAMDKTIK